MRAGSRFRIRIASRRVLSESARIPSARLAMLASARRVTVTLAFECSSGISQQVMSWMVVVSFARRGGFRQ